MNEAKYSTNVKYLVSGYELQSTVRHDTDLKSHMAEVYDLLANLSKIHAGPTKNKPQGDVPPPASEIELPKCASCGSAAHMELIGFSQNGTPKQAWKCQECQKWHYPKAAKAKSNGNGGP